jgi:N-hydroxyarylamine O-acetyltransferase
MAADHIDTGTAERVLEEMGLREWPTVDSTGLAATYRAWCRAVPFDNVRKLIDLAAVPAGVAPLPGMDADDFFASWIRHRTGGTCWPSNNGLHALLAACGFDARLVVGSMFDRRMPTHAMTIVTIDGLEWLADSSMLTDDPVPLARDRPTALDHPVFPTTATPVAEGWLVAFPASYSLDSIPCRTISPSAVIYDFCVERYEASRQDSPFNDQVVARRNDPVGVTSLRGDAASRRTADGVSTRTVDDAGAAALLVDGLGMSEEIVARLKSSRAASVTGTAS